MKLFRYGDSGAEKPGLVAPDGTLRDLSALVGDIDGTILAPDKLSELAGIDPTSLPVVEGSPRFGPPVNGIGKIIAIGLNYSDHAAETGQEMPREPVILHQGHQRHQRPQRSGDVAQEQSKKRLGGGARGNYRH